jgi:hypothetical protein
MCTKNSDLKVNVTTTGANDSPNNNTRDLSHIFKRSPYLHNCIEKGVEWSSRLNPLPSNKQFSFPLRGMAAMDTISCVAACNLITILRVCMELCLYMELVFTLGVDKPFGIMMVLRSSGNSNSVHPPSSNSMSLVIFNPSFRCKPRSTTMRQKSAKKGSKSDISGCGEEEYL